MKKNLCNYCFHRKYAQSCDDQGNRHNCSRYLSNSEGAYREAARLDRLYRLNRWLLAVLLSCLTGIATIHLAAAAIPTS